MKKIFIFITLIILGILCYYKFIYLKDIKRLLEETEERQFYIEKYSIFGTHFNIRGCIDEILEK